MWCEGDMMWGWCEGDVIVQLSMQWYLTKLGGTSIHAMSMISHEVGWLDFFVVQVSLLYQWYLTKLVCEIFFGTNEACETSDTVNVQCALPFYTPQSYPIMTILHLWSESEKTKTLRIARFLSQKLFG